MNIVVRHNTNISRQEILKVLRIMTVSFFMGVKITEKPSGYLFSTNRRENTAMTRGLEIPRVSNELFMTGI